MSKKIIQFIVIILGILIFFCFIAVIYGFYIKIYPKSEDINQNITKISLNLAKEEKIINMEVIEKNKVLITIKNSDNLQGIIYDTAKNKIVKIIEK